MEHARLLDFRVNSADDAIDFAKEAIDGGGID
jgi:hypothetical protein